MEEAADVLDELRFSEIVCKTDRGGVVNQQCRYHRLDGGQLVAVALESYRVVDMSQERALALDLACSAICHEIIGALR